MDSQVVTHSPFWQTCGPLLQLHSNVCSSVFALLCLMSLQTFVIERYKERATNCVITIIISGIRDKNYWAKEKGKREVGEELSKPCGYEGSGAPGKRDVGLGQWPAGSQGWGGRFLQQDDTQAPQPFEPVIFGHLSGSTPRLCRTEVTENYVGWTQFLQT